MRQKDAPLSLVPRMNLRPSDRATRGRLLSLARPMPRLPPLGSSPGPDIAPDGEYLVWLPRAVVNHLRALRNVAICLLRVRGACKRVRGEGGSKKAICGHQTSSLPSASNAERSTVGASQP
jgi:hypothetical protein